MVSKVGEIVSLIEEIRQSQYLARRDTVIMGLLLSAVILVGLPIMFYRMIF